jgi:hypothetical protein
MRVGDGDTLESLVRETGVGDGETFGTVVGMAVVLVG